MVEIEQISNGFILSFMNPENKKIKLYFETFDSLTIWLKQQFVKA